MRSRYLCQLANVETRAQDPFNSKKCEASLKGKGQGTTCRYKAACNVFMMDPRRVAYRSKVPIMPGAVTRLREHHFKKPCPIPMEMLFAVPNPGTVAADMAEGKCVRLSPPEFLLAYFEQISLDLDKGDDELLKAWRTTMTQTSCVFEHWESEDEMHKRALQFREDLSQNFASCRMSPVQKMFDLVSLKERKEATTGPLSAQALSDYYTQGLTFAENSEKMTFDFVDTALMVYKRMMSSKKCAAIVLELEDLGTANPLDSIYKLAKICTKASTADMIEWSLELMIDLWRSGALKSDQMAVRQLDGKQKGSCGKGLIDILTYKKDVLKYILNTYIEPLSWPPADKARIRDVCSSIQYFRSKCGYIYNTRHLKATGLDDQRGGFVGASGSAC